MVMTETHSVHQRRKEVRRGERNTELLRSGVWSQFSCLLSLQPWMIHVFLIVTNLSFHIYKIKDIKKDQKGQQRGIHTMPMLPSSIADIANQHQYTFPLIQRHNPYHSTLYKLLPISH